METGQSCRGESSLIIGKVYSYTTQTSDLALDQKLFSAEKDIFFNELKLL